NGSACRLDRLLTPVLLGDEAVALGAIGVAGGGGGLGAIAVWLLLGQCLQKRVDEAAEDCGVALGFAFDAAEFVDARCERLAERALAADARQLATQATALAVEFALTACVAVNCLHSQLRLMRPPLRACGRRF